VSSRGIFSDIPLHELSAYPRANSWQRVGKEKTSKGKLNQNLERFTTIPFANYRWRFPLFFLNDP